MQNIEPPIGSSALPALTLQAVGRHLDIGRSGRASLTILFDQPAAQSR